MTEKELLESIKKSADTVEIPESLKPEQISTKLQTSNSTRPKRFRLPLDTMQRVASAAAILLFCGILSAVSLHLPPDSLESLDAFNTEQEYLVQTINEAEESTPSKTIYSKQNAGSLYTIAKSYEQVYNLLNTSLCREYDKSEEIEAASDGIVDIAESTSDSVSSEKQVFSDYSSTNLQTQGGDEGDVIKIDGRYIYTLNDSKILITDSKDGHLTPVGSIFPDMEASDSILEFYVDNGKLLLIVQHYDTSMEDSDEETTYVEDSVFLPTTDITTSKKFSMQTENKTLVYTYNVSDPANPTLKGITTQDGIYRTSRKIGDIFYLFTDHSTVIDSTVRYKDVIPCVNGETIPYDHIYLPKAGSQELLLSSIDVNNPEQIVDNIMIVHQFADIYVGNDSIYLYEIDYGNEEILTKIAGFSMDQGMINAMNTTSIKGEILDTFAINESKGCLRILTTSFDSSGETSNNLFLLDENMKLTGSITGIAEGEQIYAARYFNDTAYFITYRNTDPLFAVDISDPSSPKILGELKINGFSEYLHFWGDDKLLGIGYETDPDSGETKGLKLAMFDISNPIDLKVIDTFVLKNYMYSPALYNYKCVLADPNANLIGFSASYVTFTYDTTSKYRLFSWEDNHFIKKMTESLPDNVNFERLRGIYIDDIFYIVDSSRIASFDRKDEYRFIEELILE